MVASVTVPAAIQKIVQGTTANDPICRNLVAGIAAKMIAIAHKVPP